MPLQIVHQDITKMRVDAIVNPSDNYFSGSGGTDYAVHKAAGTGLRRECDRMAPLQCGAVAVTQGYHLLCGHIIHTVGPVWSGGDENETVLLRSCYINAMFKAKELEAHSIAFPLISSGTFCFPKDKVLRIALDAISDFLRSTEDDIDVFLCIFDRESYTVSRQMELEQYISDFGIDAMASDSPLPLSLAYEARMMRAVCDNAPAPSGTAAFDPGGDLSDWIKNQDDSFAVMLLKLIDKKHMTDVQCYKKANIGKKTFWKINNEARYRPSKATVIAFAIALELTLEETSQLLKTVGFSLSHSNTFDVIIEFYITTGQYDINEINAALYKYDQICLGC